jgi:UPF0716 protein FxsA
VAHGAGGVAPATPGYACWAMFAVVLILLILVPIAELWLIIEVGGAIGVPATLGLLILDSLLGWALLRSQGRQAWERFNQALAERRPPAREVFDGAMIILGGALLLTPGFITDVFGICLLLPPTRALVRRGATALAARRIGFGWVVTGVGARRGRDGASGPGPRPSPGPSRAYDVEGTATEIGDPHSELEPGGEPRG